jgi:hypothetical protein
MLRNLIALRKVNDTHGHDAADQALYSAKLQGRSRTPNLAQPVAGSSRRRLKRRCFQKYWAGHSRI